MTAAKVIDKIGLDTWREYFTFCIERNLWDKAVSSFWFRKYKGKTPEERTFDDFVRNDKLPVDFRKYLHKGAPLVNFIGKFATLEQDLQFVLDQIGADCNITRPGYTLMLLFHGIRQVPLVGFSYTVSEFCFCCPTQAL